MKELVSALSQATANRLKSPILGSFIISWVTWNHDQVIEFIFSTSPQKIQLAKDLDFHLWSDLFIPFIIAMVYTFCLPLFQHWIDSARHKFIDDKRTKAQHGRLKDRYDSQAEASESQAKSSLEYWRDRLSRNLDRWDEDRTLLNSKVDDLERDLKHEKELKQSAEVQQQETISQLNSSNEFRQEQQNQIEELSRKLDSAHSTLESIIRSIEDSNITKLTNLVSNKVSHSADLTTTDIGQIKREATGLDSNILNSAANNLLIINDLKKSLIHDNTDYNQIFSQLDSLKKYLAQDKQTDLFEIDKNIRQKEPTM